MLTIMSLDAGAYLGFSEFNGQWFVRARLWIGDGFFLSLPTVHHEDPGIAVVAYLERLKAIREPEYIALERAGSPRREYRWNGAAFVDVTRPEVEATT